MPVTRRISDSELRERLEDHGYRVPPITETTRAVLNKKLKQLDDAASRDRRYSGLDYSSAEDDEMPAPLASSTRTGGLARHQDDLAVTSRGGRHSNGVRVTRKQASLMTHSEEEASEDEEEEEEEDVEEEEEEEESEEEEEVNGDRVDFGMQTSMLDSPSPQPHNRFRGQKLNNTPSSYMNTPSITISSPSPSFPIMSPYLRKSIKQHSKHGSLDEALSTLPASSKSSKMKQPVNSSVTSQASPSKNSSYNQSYNKETSGICSSMLVSSLIIVLAAVFFLLVLFQYLSLVPPQARPALAACSGLAGEHPGATCVLSSELNGTVHLYKQIHDVLPTRGCWDSDLVSEQRFMELLNEKYPDSPLTQYLDNLLVLLRQNESWGIRVEEVDGKNYLRKVSGTSVVCKLLQYCWSVLQAVRDATFLILTVLAALSGLLAVFKLYQWRRERRQRRREEIFQLVRGATSLVYQHSVREGRAGHSTGVPIIHVRDRLIPLEQREAKAGLWGEAVEYISNNESRLRQEIQKLYGEDFHVWKWLGEISWSPQESFSPSSPSLPSSPSPPVSPGSPSMSSPSTHSNPWPHVPTTHSLAPC